MGKKPQYIRWFNESGLDDVALVGGKNASLGELYRELTKQGVNVPNGFATTATAWRHMLNSAGAVEPLHRILDKLDPDNTADLAARASEAREIIVNANIPDDLADDILAASHQLQTEYGPSLSLAVRSSATAEDLPTASFAGQHDSYLNISGDDALLSACRDCYASLFTDRAIQYRINNGFDHFKVDLSIGIMKMVRADRASSGVMFSLDTESGFRDVVFITGAWGLGENVVQGTVDPDEFYVHKPTYLQGYRKVLRRSLGKKQIKMIYSDALEDGGVTGSAATRNIDTVEAEQQQYCLTDDDVLKLADYAIRIEEHYSHKSGHPMPMDMEWAKDADDGKLYIVQARPETVASQQKDDVIEEFILDEAITQTAKVLVQGKAVGSKIASGKVRVLKNVNELSEFQDGEVLVADMTTPDWGAVMKRASAIVTNRGGRTCHAAIVARELGVPAIVGTASATRELTTGQSITVSCASGETGLVYDGCLPYQINTIDVTGLQKPKTAIMMNIANPEMAFAHCMLPNDGVGLARLEFIINETIQIHPQALLFPERVTDSKAKETIDQLTRNYASNKDYFIQKLSEGVATIAAAFYPKPVVVRLSDFKSNEYANLIGGKDFEPIEENPMLGFRGASRYTHPDFKEAFQLECEALKIVREKVGLTNVKIMVPFCRRIEEAEKVIQALQHAGLVQGEQGLEIYVMCEIPNNVILIDEFAKIFDGFSIGSNDLTQLTLGVDRDSLLVADDFDELDEGVKIMLKMAVEGAKRNNRYIGICGQAPSDYPEMAEYLINLGVDSMSLNPDAVLKTMLAVAELEQSV